MSVFERIKENPILSPDPNKLWEAIAAFNPSVIVFKNKLILTYRALSDPTELQGVAMNVSSIGYAEGSDGIHFSGRRQILWPEHEWEAFGCEDPRVCELDGKFYIFYTALSTYPFSAQGIHIGVAVTSDFIFFEKHQVTRFNSKAMVVFPEKINGQWMALLTVHTDLPPGKIALARFEKEEDMWSEKYWYDWYMRLDEHVIPLLRDIADQVEVGAAPLKTDKGWLLIYSYISNYYSDNKIFGIEAVLLDRDDPSKVIGKTNAPLLAPEAEYELHGDVPNITFPGSALLRGDKVYLYYGAADTTCCLALGDLEKLLENMRYVDTDVFTPSKWIRQSFHRYEGNPILSPRPEFAWEAKACFNPAVIYEDSRFHIIYRAMSMDDTSVFGYASSHDGIHIDERLHYPVYKPRAGFEKKLRPGNSGCEDPRITRMGDVLFMFYTAYDGYTPRVAFTSISVEDFLNRNWNWAAPRVITPPGIPDKDACLLGRKIKGKYVIFHRAYDCICINKEEDLNFDENKWLVHDASLIEPRKTYWDNSKFGLAAPPIETKWGWLMFFHRATLPDSVYKVEAALLDLEDPSVIIAQTDATLLEPERDYEGTGLVSNVVFPCGAVLLNGFIHLYYGGADRICCVARMELPALMKRFGICI